MFLNTMKNASFSWSDYKELPRRLSTFAFYQNVLLIMPNVVAIAKKNLSTWLSYEEKETCRTFWYQKKLGQSSLPFDTFPYHFMANNFFAFSAVASATSSKVSPLISAI